MSITKPYQDILDRLPQKFQSAKQSGELLFFDSETKEVVTNGRKFEVRICPALANKLQATKEALSSVGVNVKEKEEEKEKTSPFEPPYIEDLHVGDVEGFDGEDGMAVLLNKYSVVPHHILLTSLTNQPQSLPPSPSQLLNIYLHLLTASEHPTTPTNLLAFYNGGEGGGASQDWRHAQIIPVGRRGAPVESWLEGVTGPKDKAFPHPTLPYLHLLYRLPSPTSLPYPPTEESTDVILESLAKGLMALLDEMFDAWRRGECGRDGGWNLLMTLNHLHLIPRSSPSFSLPTHSLDLNSLAYAGLLLVKSAEELSELEDSTQGKGLEMVLERCGVPRAWGVKEEEEEGALAGCVRGG